MKHKSLRFWGIGAAVLLLALLLMWAIGQSAYQLTSTQSVDGNAPRMKAGSPAAMDAFGIAPTVGGAANDSEVFYEESASSDTTVDRERLIIKTGALSVHVADVQGAAAQIAEFAAGQGGFLVSSNMYEQGTRGLQAEVTIRIPVAVFDQGVASLKGLGEVVSERINGQDVTEEFVDLDAQVRNLRRTEAQFLEIMARATRIEDVLAVQRELTQVRGQIDRIQGRMNYLEKSAALSTLTVHLSEDPESLPVLDDDDVWKPISTIKNAARSLVAFGTWLADGIIWVVIFIPVWLVLWMLLHYIKRFWKKKQ